MSPSSVRSYRDSLRLLLVFVAGQRRRPITRLGIEDLTADRVREFLSHLEAERGNHIRTRNQRLAALHTFFAYLAGQAPEMLAEAERVAAIPMKRAPPPGTRFLERDEIEALFSGMPTGGHSALRDEHFYCSFTTPERACRKSRTLWSAISCSSRSHAFIFGGSA